MRNIVGAGAIVHEGQHQRDFNRLWQGNGPQTKAQLYRTELNAYRAQQGVEIGSGMNTGLYNQAMSDGQLDQAVAESAQRSVDTWCDMGGAC